MTPAQRAAGLEKMARAMLEATDGHMPWDDLPQWHKDEMMKDATAALAAWEAHEKECGLVYASSATGLHVLPGSTGEVTGVPAPLPATNKKPRNRSNRAGVET